MRSVNASNSAASSSQLSLRDLVSEQTWVFILILILFMMIAIFVAFVAKQLVDWPTPCMPTVEIDILASASAWWPWLWRRRCCAASVLHRHEVVGCHDLWVENVDVIAKKSTSYSILEVLIFSQKPHTNDKWAYMCHLSICSVGLIFGTQESTVLCKTKTGFNFVPWKLWREFTICCNNGEFALDVCATMSWSWNSVYFLGIITPKCPLLRALVIAMLVVWLL